MILSEVQSLYAYDSLGRKLSRIDNDTWEYYIYDGMNLVADYDAYNGRIIRTYTYGPGVDNIQSMTIYDEYGGSETYYYIKDASNAVHVLVDEDGLIVEYYYYDAFGNVKMRDENYQWMTESNYGNRFLFQGREYDYDAALYYFRARWYEPETGRWLSPDPIGISGGLNLYAFCGNDPVNFVDPSGRERSVPEKIKEIVDDTIAASSRKERLLGQAGEYVCEEMRYIDTPGGTIDLKHVVSAATTTPIIGWSIGGDFVEINQIRTDYESSLNYGDLLSNAVGGWAQGAYIADSGLFLLGLGGPPLTIGGYVSKIILWLEPIGGLYGSN